MAKNKKSRDNPISDAGAGAEEDDSGEMVRIEAEEDEESAVEAQAIQPAISQPRQQQQTGDRLKWEQIHQERKQQLAFLKVWAQDVSVPIHMVADRCKIKAGDGLDWLRILLGVAKKNGGDTQNTHFVIKQMFNTALAPHEGNLQITDDDISALITLDTKHGQELERAAQLPNQRQSRQLQQQQQPRQQYADPVIAVGDESHNYHNNLNNDNTMSMQQTPQEQQFEFAEIPLLENILRNQGVFGARIPGILANYKTLRSTYLANPQRLFEMLRSQLGQVNAVGVFQNYQDAMGLHHPDVAAQSPGLTGAMPAAGIFSTPNAGNQNAGLMGSPQWASQPMNPNMWQYISQGMPPPPTGGSMADYFIWQKMYETWQEDQKFKRDQHRTINNIMGGAGAGQPGGQQDIMSQIIPVLAATRQDLMVTWNYDPNTGRQVPSLVPNPSYQQNNKADANTEITKAMMGMLSTIASGMIGQQNKPDQATQLLGSILPAVMNKAFNSTDQVQAIQKMIEISQTLQKPNVQMDPNVAQAQIDTKFAMWREELDYRKTVRDWDVQDRREKQAAQQQSQFLDMFKEAGKDAVPALLKMFSGPLMSMFMPKGATPEQMMAAAAQRAGMPPGMMPPGMMPGMIPPGMQMPQEMMQQPPQHMHQHQPQQQRQQVINPFQGGGGMPQEINPFQGQMPMNPSQYQQPPPQYQQQPAQQQQEEEQHLPSPEEFMQMHPQEIDALFENIHRKQTFLSQFENNARIGKARQKMMSQPPIMQHQYQPSNMPQGGAQPGYGEGFVSNRGPGQTTDEDYVDENQFAYEMMPANTMTDAEESSKGGQVMSTNDLRNEIADYSSQQIPDQQQGGGDYEPQGYDAINTQGMEQYEPPAQTRPQPGQAQSAIDFEIPNQEQEPAPSGNSSIPEISEPLEPIPGTQVASNQPSPAQQPQPQPQQGNERVIRRPSRNN